MHRLLLERLELQTSLGRLNAKRINGADCAVYRGKFVVTSGNPEVRGGNLTKTVEAYDHVDFHAEHGAGH